MKGYLMKITFPNGVLAACTAESIDSACEEAREIMKNIMREHNIETDEFEVSFCEEVDVEEVW